MSTSTGEPIDLEAFIARLRALRQSLDEADVTARAVAHLDAAIVEAERELRRRRTGAAAQAR